MPTRIASAPPEPTDPADQLLDSAALPKRFGSVDELDNFLAMPSQALIDDLARARGDILILGVAGKMGPTLARLAKNAAPDRRVIGVARFSDKAVQARLDAAGVETIAADLLNRAEIDALPRVPNVVFAAGHKFGASGNPSLTWAMNTWVPALVAESFRESRIVAFSTGNVYPLTTIGRQAATEATPPAPVGDYAQSCVGRERMFAYFSGRYGMPGRIFRLNYAIDMRYGVLADIAGKIRRGQPVDVTMGHINVIWQGDANAQVLRCLAHCTTPTTPINCTGPETLSVRWLAAELGARLGVEPQITGQEAPTALLSDTTRASALFGYPRVPMGAMLDWVADWVGAERESFNKPTKFEVRDGGSEALSLVALSLSDVAGGLVLSAGAGWNQTADDWAFFIRHGHAVGFRTTSGVLVATAAALVYGGGFGWISMVLVSPDWRHRGLASRLVDDCVKRLRALHVTPVLDATPAGQPVYRQLGFHPGFEFERWEGTLAAGVETAKPPTDAEAAALRSAGPSDLDAIAALDQAAAGAGRRALLQDILGRSGTRAWMTRDGSGFVIVRDGQRAAQFGPLVAAEPAGALALLGAALRLRTGALFLDVPTRWRELAAALEARGFMRQRPFARMALGGVPFACSDRLFALAGPEFG